MSFFDTFCKKCHYNMGLHKSVSNDSGIHVFQCPDLPKIPEAPAPSPVEEPKANDMQVGGKHYKAAIQHWDYAASHSFDYFQGQVTKYVTRWKKKNGLEDLKKAQHFLNKYIELVEAGTVTRES